MNRGRFDAGGFDLLAGEIRTLRFIADTDADLEKAAATLTVRQLHSATY